MLFMISSLFFLIDMAAFISSLMLLSRFTKISLNILKNQMILMISIFVVSVLFLNSNIEIALNLAQPSFFDVLYGTPGVSVLDHCNSPSELLIFTLLVGGSCLTYNLLFESYVLKLAHTATLEEITSVPIFGPEPLLSSKAQRLNLNREDLLTLANLYNDQLFNFIRRISHNQAYDLHRVKDFLQLSNYQYLYGLLFRDHTLLHAKLLPYINPACVTNFVELPNALNGRDLISWQLVANLNNNTKEKIVLSDLYGVVTERIFQLQGDKCIPLVIIPDRIYPTLPIVGYQTNKSIQVFDIPTTYTNLWEQYIVPSYKFIISFFF